MRDPEGSVLPNSHAGWRSQFTGRSPTTGARLIHNATRTPLLTLQGDTEIECRQPVFVLKDNGGAGSA